MMFFVGFVGCVDLSTRMSQPAGYRLTHTSSLSSKYGPQSLNAPPVAPRQELELNAVNLFPKSLGQPSTIQIVFLLAFVWAKLLARQSARQADGPINYFPF